MRVDFDAWSHILRTTDLRGQTLALQSLVQQALENDGELKELIDAEPGERENLAEIKRLCDQLSTLIPAPKQFPATERVAYIVEQESWQPGSLCLARVDRKWMEAEFLAIDEPSNRFVVILQDTLQTIFCKRIKRRAAPKPAIPQPPASQASFVRRAPAVSREKMRSDAKVAVEQKRSWQEFQKKIKK